jgi:hypothetical protein
MKAAIFVVNLLLLAQAFGVTLAWSVSSDARSYERQQGKALFGLTVVVFSLLMSILAIDLKLT